MDITLLLSPTVLLGENFFQGIIASCLMRPYIPLTSFDCPTKASTSDHPRHDAREISFWYLLAMQHPKTPSIHSPNPLGELRTLCPCTLGDTGLRVVGRGSCDCDCIIKLNCELHSGDGCWCLSSLLYLYCTVPLCLQLSPNVALRLPMALRCHWQFLENHFERLIRLHLNIKCHPMMIW